MMEVGVVLIHSPRSMLIHVHRSGCEGVKLVGSMMKISPLYRTGCFVRLTQVLNRHIISPEI